MSQQLVEGVVSRVWGVLEEMQRKLSDSAKSLSVLEDCHQISKTDWSQNLVNTEMMKVKQSSALPSKLSEPPFWLQLDLLI